MRGTAILLLVALLTGGFYFLHAAPDSRDKALRAELASRFLRMDPKEIDFIRIQNAHGSFELVKDRQSWRMTAPRKSPADDRTLARILELVRNGKVLKVVSADPAKGKEFGLDHPAAVLYVGYRGNLGQLSLGAPSPTQNGVYAYANGINAIFLVDKEIASSLDVDLLALRSKSVFSFDPEAVTAVSLSGKGGTVEMARDGAGWRMLRPVPGKADDEAVRNLLLGIANQRADDILDDHFPGPEACRETMTIELLSGPAGGGGQRNSLRACFLGTGARQGAFAYQQGMPYAGRFPREFWDFVSRDPARYRYRKLFALEESGFSTIRVQRESAGYELRRKGDSWFLGERAVDAGKVRQLVWFLKGWNADRMLGATSHTKNTGKSLEIAVSDPNGATRTLAVFGKMDGPTTGFSSVYAFSGALNEFCAVNDLDLKKIPTKEEFLQ